MIWISLPYATFGLVVSGERITRAPPIARWTVGKSVDAVVAYYQRKGAQVKRIP